MPSLLFVLLIPRNHIRMKLPCSTIPLLHDGFLRPSLPALKPIQHHFPYWATSIVPALAFRHIHPSSKCDLKGYIVYAFMYLGCSTVDEGWKEVAQGHSPLGRQRSLCWWDSCGLYDGGRMGVRLDSTESQWVQSHTFSPRNDGTDWSSHVPQMILQSHSWLQCRMEVTWAVTMRKQELERDSSWSRLCFISLSS